MSSYSYQALGLDDSDTPSTSSEATSLSSKSIALSFQDVRSSAFERSAQRSGGGMDGSVGESLLGGGLSDSSLRSKLQSDRAYLGLGSVSNRFDDDARKCRWDKPSRLVRMDRRTMCFRFTLLFLSVLIVFSGYFQFDLPAIIAKPYLYDKFGINEEQFAIIFVGYSISNTIVPLLSGPFFGKFGKWRGVTLIALTITIGIAIVWVGVLVGGTAGYNILVLGRAIYGLGGESVFVGVDILVTKWFQGAEMGFAYGLIQAAGQAGSFSALYSVPSLVKYWGDSVNNCFLLSFALSCTALAALGLARVIEKTAYGKKGAAGGLKGMGDGHMHENASLMHSAAAVAAAATMDGVAAQKHQGKAGGAAASAAGASKGHTRETDSLLRSEGGGGGGGGAVGGGLHGEEGEGEEEEKEELDTETESPELRQRLERNLACLRCFPPLYNAILYLGFGHLTTLHWDFYAVVGGIIAYSSAFYTFLAWGPQWLQNNYNMDNTQAGQTAGIIAIFSMVISPTSGLVMDRYGGQRYVCFGAMLSAFVWFTIMGFATVPPAVCIVFAGISYSLLPASLYPLLPEVVPPESFTIVYAVLNSAINLVFTIVLLVSGRILGQDGTSNLRRRALAWVEGEVMAAASGARELNGGGGEEKVDPKRFQYLFAIFMTITAAGSIATGFLARDAYLNHATKGWVPLANKH